jgi:hypothetical protein
MIEFSQNMLMRLQFQRDNLSFQILEKNIIGNDVINFSIQILHVDKIWNYITNFPV